MTKVDKDVAAMLKSLNKLDDSSKRRLMENGYYTSGIADIGGAPDPNAADALPDMPADIPDGCCADDDTTDVEFTLSESGDVPPELLQDLVARYQSGEINYSEFKAELASAEQDCCGEGEASEWYGASVLENIDEEDEEMNEFLEAVKKSQIPAAQRKASGDKDWKLTSKDLEDEEDQHISGSRGLEKHKQEQGVKEGADPEVMAWMQRFNMLG